MSGDPTQAGGDSARLSISKEQRDLLFERIISDLAGAEAILEAVRGEEWDKADRLSRNLCNGLTFVMNDLGWVVDNERPIEVSTSPLVVREVLEQLRAEAKDLDPHIDVRGAAEENQELIATCERLLTSLEAQVAREGPRGSAALPFGDPTEGKLAQQETLRLLMGAHPRGLGWQEIIQSVAADFPECGVAGVERALHELLDADLVERRDFGFAATEGAMLINRLWDDLTDVC
ncbi:MAG TPA: hypothetical protein VNC16_08840 [Solirubrobacterales bacterium]|jgi:hypothetical protein|nr:hypothetical protein [Solirubrobacterales bacterium]